MNNNFSPWKYPSITPFTKGIKCVLIRGAPESLRSSVVPFIHGTEWCYKTGIIGSNRNDIIPKEEEPAKNASPSKGNLLIMLSSKLGRHRATEMANKA
jgi:hypothetical protein